MDSVLPHHGPANGWDPTEAAHALAGARASYYEDPVSSLAVAIRCHEVGRGLDDHELRARALALQGAISLHRGDLQGALSLAVEAERHAERSREPGPRAEVAALKGQLSFFTGSYAEALSHAERSVALADLCGELPLRVFVRRSSCLVFGNVGVPDWRHRLQELLTLAIESGSAWEEAISRNDLACYLQEQGDADAAEQEIARALAALEGLDAPHDFALAVLHSTRADIRLLAGHPDAALADAQLAIAALTAGAEPNPYVLGVTVRAEVQARMSLGHFDDAQRSGEGALSWLGDRVPQTRSLILSTLAQELRRAGRLEEAYDALARSAELERQAFRELSELQISLERATLETRAARRESDALAASHRELAEAHAELGRRAAQLETLQDQLRDQAERDWLTGLHNRRYLARALERLSGEGTNGPISLAVMDLDLFKSINDRFGHATGDHVLVRVAGLLCDVLRDTDVVIRSGGEEFLVLMPATDVRAAATCCERIRHVIRSEAWDAVAPGLVVTASVGLACAQAPDDLEALVRLADQRLYEAKHGGRDRLVAPLD
jgi:diguanylate cyclase (GGDEF)-like protein